MMKNMMANPMMSLAQRDKVDDNCVMVLLKLTYLNICKRTELLLLGGGRWCQNVVHSLNRASGKLSNPNLHMKSYLEVNCIPDVNGLYLGGVLGLGAFLGRRNILLGFCAKVRRSQTGLWVMLCVISSGRSGALGKETSK